MKSKFFYLTVLLFISSFSFSQVDSTNLIQMIVPDSLKNPIISVFHSMGNVSVKGNNNSKLVVYAEELLPSVSELTQGNSSKIFQFIDSKSKRPVTVNQNAKFLIQQIGNLFKIETNVFSLNSNVFVLAPKRSSVSVNNYDMGNVTIENFEGDVEANASTGRVLLKNIDGAISASTEYGNVIADMSDKDVSRPIFISTFVGNIEIIVAPTSKNSVLLSSELGKLYSNFDTMNTISIASTASTKKNRKFRFDLNGGGTEFVLNTFKGDIYLRYHEQ